MTIKPMPLWKAALFFGFPALTFRLSLYSFLPALIQRGLPAFAASLVSFTVPAAILFAFAFGFYKRDGFPVTWLAIKSRFHLQRMSGRDWFWAMGGFIVSFLSIGLLAPTSLFLIKSIPALAPMDFFPPWLKPGVNFDLALFSQYIAAPLKGNWSVVILFSIMLFFNIFGEELWWRGYIFPRQELVHGRWTWLVHGTLWLLWHVVFYPWQLFTLLPICLILPYIAQRRHNTWVAIIIHLQNGIVLFIILAAVLGF